MGMTWRIRDAVRRKDFDEPWAPLDLAAAAERLDGERLGSHAAVIVRALCEGLLQRLMPIFWLMALSPGGAVGSPRARARTGGWRPDWCRPVVWGLLVNPDPYGWIDGRVIGTDPKGKPKPVKR
jgi:hypothetical protein